MGNPFSKDWPHNNMVFWVAKNGAMPDAFLPFLNSIGNAEKTLGELFKVPEISKKTVTVHADFHDYNFLYENNKDKLRVIDLDTSWVGNPLMDLTRNMWTMNLQFAERQELVRAYLEHSGIKNVTDQKVHDMLYDSEGYKLFTAVEGYVWKLFDNCGKERDEDSKFTGDQLKQLIDIWAEAGKSQKSQMRLNEIGLFSYVHENNKQWSKWATTSRCGQSIGFIQPDHRQNEEFTNLFELRGSHGAKVDMNQVNGFISHLLDMFKPEYAP